MIKIDIDLNAELAQESLRSVLSALTGPEAIGINKAAGEEVRNEASEYHREFDAAGGWKGNRYLGGSPRSGAFGARVAQGWFLGNVERDGVTITNNAEHLAFKVSGGTITPKRAKALTIPLISEASGLYARDYIRITGNKLFTIKGKSALFERISSATAGRPNIRAVFALVRSVTLRPWPNALPPEGRLEETFVRSYRDELIRKIEAS